MKQGAENIDEEEYIRAEQFKHGLIKWVGEQAQFAATESNDLPSVSIEVPVFKGEWLIPCIESVLNQTVNRWVLYLVWDEGDALSYHILQIVHLLNYPRFKVYFSLNQGIARSRHLLSALADEDYIIPLDDDDLLHPTIVEDLTWQAVLNPWASIIRARRKYVDENGDPVIMPDWFPFENRKYQYGMVTDVFNHCQPTLLSRKAYRQTSGWEGFPDFYYAGEDCDIYLKLEEKGAVELYDKVLYYYRLNTKRTSHLLTPEGAHEMWRRLADRSIARIGLPLKRVNAHPPFIYERTPLPSLTTDMIDFVIITAGTEKNRNGRSIDKCLKSLKAAGINDSAIYVVNEKASCLANRNHGYSLTTRPLICFMDGNCEIIHERSIEDMLSLMTTQNADLIGPQIVTSNDAIFSSYPAFSENQYPVLNSACESDDMKQQSNCEVTWLPSTFLLLKREVIKAINGFEEVYEDGLTADVDFCFKARVRSFKCIYAGKTSVRYNKGQMINCSDKDFKQFIQRWGGRKELFRSVKPNHS